MSNKIIIKSIILVFMLGALFLEIWYTVTAIINYRDAPTNYRLIILDQMEYYENDNSISINNIKAVMTPSDEFDVQEIIEKCYVFRSSDYATYVYSGQIYNSSISEDEVDIINEHNKLGGIIFQSIALGINALATLIGGFLWVKQ